MDRDTLSPILIAILAVVALGIGAATLDTVDSGGERFGAGDAGSGAFGFGVGEPIDFSQPSSAESTPSVAPSVTPMISRVFTVLLTVVLIVGLYAWRDDLREFGSILAVCAGVLLGGYLLYNLFKSGTRQMLNQSHSGEKILPGGGSLGGGAPATIDSVTVGALVGVLVIAIVVGYWFLRGDVGSDPETNPDPDSDESAADTIGVGRAAGRAADRISEREGKTENEVYRAWAEMTEQFDMTNPRASTPEEFARAATDAGIARDDVDELTDLFRGVRYGGRRATDGRETQAVTTLQRIERKYAN